MMVSVVNILCISLILSITCSSSAHCAGTVSKYEPNGPGTNVNERADHLYEKAVEMLESRTANKKIAFTLLQESAQLDHQKAKELMARSHIFADHLPFNPRKAFNYLRSIPINESSGAHLLLGFMYSIGLRVHSNPHKSLMHYTLAANMDNSLAKMAVGFKYMYGMDVHEDCGQAKHLYHSVATSVVHNSRVSGGHVIRNKHLWRQSDRVIQNLDKDLIDYYKFLAKKGDINACVSLGQLYYFGGFGVDRDVDTALNYLQTAAKSRNANALALLGHIYLEGSPSVGHNFTKAYQLLKASAQKRNPIAQAGLGFMFLTGKGVDIDFKDAFEYFALSSRQGWVEGIVNLGLMYMNGLGVARDYRRAIRFFTLALQSQHLLAVYHLGQLFGGGHGVAISCRTAVSHFKSVAERGVWSRELAEADNHYKNNKVLQAFMKYAFLSDMGYESAQSNSAFILENKAIDGLDIDGYKRQSLAVKYWTQSAAQGLSFSRIKVGDHHYYGMGTPVNYGLAAQYYRKASELRYSSAALFNLGFLHENGLGVHRNTKMALIYYDMSAQVDSDAKVAVFLAKHKLKATEQLQTFLSFFDLRKYFGNKWDLVLIFVLFIALTFAVYFRLK